MKYVISVLFLILLIALSPGVTAQIENRSGAVFLALGNNWSYKEDTGNIRLGSTLLLSWISNGSTTGKINCSLTNQVSKTVSPTNEGKLELIASSGNCSFLLYQLAKPTNNVTSYNVTFQVQVEKNLPTPITSQKLIINFPVTMYLVIPTLLVSQLVRRKIGSASVV